ncbi:hypothetical protein [Rhodopirellula sp. SWK7]|uniref:hypothetical protein n=1 Tax=Rhodopirellula sp. SWK7 TaxID=595460 RepID=UPI0002BF72BD|nr:hypothetical protein [Rhodopirellula sp. SWK7]EMI45566.1 hypothetical protein RRSWK_01970 [Rhodopirellula sp. SWK7]
MHPRRHPVGFFFQGLLLWGVVVGIGLNVLKTSAEAVANLDKTQACFAADAVDSPAMHAESMLRWQATSGDKFEPKLAGVFVGSDSIVGSWMRCRASNPSWVGASHWASLVLLGVRLQI